MLLSLNLLLRTPIVTRLSPFFSFSFPNIQQNKLDSKVQKAYGSTIHQHGIKHARS